MYFSHGTRRFPGDSKPFIRNVFTLNTCSHIVGSQVLSFDDEKELFTAWQQFVEEVDPDVVIGYNIANFDFPYLLDRAKALKADKFPLLGRIKGWLLLAPVSDRSLMLLRRYQGTDKRGSLLVEGVRPTRLEGYRY